MKKITIDTVLTGMVWLTIATLVGLMFVNLGSDGGFIEGFGGGGFGGGGATGTF